MAYNKQIKISETLLPIKENLDNIRKVFRDNIEIMIE